MSLSNRFAILLESVWRKRRCSVLKGVFLKEGLPKERVTAERLEYFISWDALRGRFSENMAFLSSSITHLAGLCRRILTYDVDLTLNTVGEAHTPVTNPEQLLAVPLSSRITEGQSRGFTVGDCEVQCHAATTLADSTENAYLGNATPSAATGRAFANGALPQEILDMIFLIAVDFRSRAVQHSCRMESDTARYVSQVCRHWRFAALHNSKIWKQALDPDSNSFMWLVIILKRCDFKPLALVSTPKQSLSLADAAKWTLLRRVFRFCQYMHVELKRDGDARCIRWLLSRPAPHLVDATLVWDHKDRRSGTPPSLTINRPLLFRHDAPNLRRLRFINCAPDEGIKFPSLRCMLLEFLPGHRQDFHRPGPDSILLTLQCFTALTQLTLCCIQDHLLGGAPNVGTVAKVRLPLLQVFTYDGDGAMFMAVNDRLELPTLCNRHVSIDFCPFYPWGKDTIDALIARCLDSIPIMSYSAMGVCLQQRRLYISFGDPVQFEFSFDLRDLCSDDLTRPKLIQRILTNCPGVTEYRGVDYFVCAVRDWIFYHPKLSCNVTTLRLGSTIHGAATLAMLPLVWAFPSLENLHIPSCESLCNPYLVSALGRPQGDACNPEHLQTITIPFCSLVDMHCPSNERDMDGFRRVLQRHASTSLLSLIQRIELSVSNELLRNCGQRTAGVVMERVGALGRLLSPWRVSWGVVDSALLQRYRYPPPRTIIARDQRPGDALH